MMDLSDGISLLLEQLASKKNSLRKAILMLALEAKNLDEHLDSTKESFSECATVLESKAKALESNRDSAVESSRKLDAVQDLLESRMKKLEVKEEEFRSLLLEKESEFKRKEGQLVETRMWVEQKMKDVELKEERLSEQTKSMRVLLEKIQVEKQEFDTIKEYVGEISLKERKISDRSKELNLVKDWIERRAKELDLKEEKVEMRDQQLKDKQISNDERCQELDVLTQELDRAQKLNEERSQKLDSKENTLSSVQEYVRKSFDDYRAKSRELKIAEELLEKQQEDQSKVFEYKAKRLEERCKYMDLKEKQIKERVKDFELKEKQLEKQFKDSESKMLALLVRRFEERTKDFLLKETQLEERTKVFSHKAKQLEEQLVEFELKKKQLEERCKDMDLKEKQIEERVKDFELKQKQFEEQFEERLKDLVLKETQLEERTKGLESKDNIGSKEKQLEESTLLSSMTDSCRPKRSMSAFGSTSAALSSVLVNMDGNNLLLFIIKHEDLQDLMIKEVSFALATSSDSGKLVLDATQGFLSPVFTEADSDIDMRALRSYVFLLDILKSLEPVISSQVKLESLELALDWKANAGMREANSVLTLGFSRFLDVFGLTSAFGQDETLNLDKHADTNPLGFSINLTEHNVPGYEKKISRFEQYTGVPEYIWRASDPAKLVLDAIEGCYYSKFGPQNMSKLEVLKSITFLLSQLLRVSVEVPTQVKEQATKLAADWKEKELAADWKEKVKGHGFAEIWCFLLFLTTYKVASCCNNAELLDFLEIVLAARKASEDAIDLLRSLGLENEVPNFVKILIERGLHLDAINLVCLLGLGDKFPPATLLESYINYEKAAAERIRAEGQYSEKSKANAANKELKALEQAVICSERRKLETQYPLENIKTRIQQLKRQKLAPKGQLKERDDIQSKNIHTKKRKSFGPEHAKEAQFPCPFHSVYPLQDEHDRPYISCPLYGFGNDDKYGYLPSYDARPDSFSEMHFWPPVGVQRRRVNRLGEKNC